MNPSTWLTRFLAWARREPTSELKPKSNTIAVLSVPEIATATAETQTTGSKHADADARFMEFVSHSLGDMISGHLTSVEDMLPLGANGERVMISTQFTNLRTLAGQLRVLASLIDARIPEPRAAAVAATVEESPINHHGETLDERPELTSANS